MADLIDRGRFWDNLNDEFEMGVTDAIEAVNNALDNTPTVDAVPVVRCRDCKWCLYDEEYGKCWCNRVLGAIPVKAADYCSYGNRREAADNG